MKKFKTNLLVVTYAPIMNKQSLKQSYPPYVNEMELWMRYSKSTAFCCPISYPDDIFLKPFKNQDFTITRLPFVAFNKFGTAIKSIFWSPIIFFRICLAMSKTEHIHLRCPGNISLIACIAQIFFPGKSKTTKYAGNWDPKSKQPWSYKLQQAILRNRFLTRNMKVLVYGEWPNEPEHIIPFISATYYDRDRVPFQARDYDQILEFVFAASLVPGKRPLLTIQIIEALNKRGYPAVLHMFGDGPLRPELEAYIETNDLETQIQLYGNRDIQELKAYYQRAHFNILPSKSEGWPKAVAEGMFFGCVPLTTRVSCVGWMLEEGQRGILIEPDLEEAVSAIIEALEHKDLQSMAQRAQSWSEAYTFDRLEEEIKNIITNS